MVKRATIHVSSRTKKNHPKNGGIRGITKDKKRKRKKQQIQPIQHFTTLQESRLQYGPGEAVVFGCLPCRRIVYTRSVFCPREALLFVVKVVLVVFPTQQAASRNFVLAKRCYLL